MLAFSDDANENLGSNPRLELSSSSSSDAGSDSGGTSLALDVDEEGAYTNAPVAVDDGMISSSLGSKAHDLFLITDRCCLSYDQKVSVSVRLGSKRAGHNLPLGGRSRTA